MFRSTLERGCPVTRLRPKSVLPVLCCRSLWRRQDHVHVTTLAVQPSHRRQGLGQALLKAVCDEFPHMDVTLEVRKSNEDAQDFYRSAGFTVTGLRPDYYTDNGEDALVMSWHADSREAVGDGRT